MGCRWPSVQIRPPRPFFPTEVATLDFLTVFFIALGLSADCFAVSVGGSAAMKPFSRVQVLRVAVAFGAAQTLMPVIGWAAGRTVVDLISAYDHWVAFGLLAVVGGRMIWESLHHEGDEAHSWDITRGVSLLLLAVATSIDSLAVGLTFAFLDINIVTAAAIIGVVAFLVTVMGLVVGRKAGSVIGKRSEVIGGLVLIGIGIRVLVSHLL